MSDRARMTGQVVFLTIALAVFWLAFIADLQPDDLYVGIPAVILSVAFAFFSIRRLPIRFRPTLRDLMQLWRLPWYIVSGIAEIAWVLAKDLVGKRAESLFRAAPWYPNGDDGHDIALRSLAVAYTTVAPNFIIVGIDRERGRMLFHQVSESSVPIMTQRLGAGSGE
ncbi:MAG TPA: hypothetical protein VKT75_01060 [Acidobacteriaceae bacterium]|nr:hypothetical protein [Acidobacteriaceae bacterium]